MKKYLAYCQGDILLTAQGTIPCGEECPITIKPWNLVTTLRVGEDEVLVIRLDAPVRDTDDYRMYNLRATYDFLTTTDYNLAGKGAELLYWDQNTKYCGCCGAPMRWDTEISKKCTECGKELWPQLAIAIIVRVVRGDEILLVHANNFRGNHYGLVAGFVETGETLEQAVERELWEETHIQVNNIRYFGSQPWPYPCGLMVGFTADYESGEVQLQRSEIGAGGWFCRHNLPEIPNKASIARWLIDDWFNNQK